MNNETFAMFRQSDEFEPDVDANKVMIASAFDDFLRRIVRDTANMSILEETSTAIPPALDGVKVDKLCKK